MYLTYEEYQEWGGTLSQEEFDDLEFGAEAIINYATFNRLKNDTIIPVEVKRAIKYLIEVAYNKTHILTLQTSEDGSMPTGAYIKSQSNDGVSISYANMEGPDVYNVMTKEANRVVMRYLHGVTNEAGYKLLYRGLYPGE